MTELQGEINRAVGEILAGSLKAPSTGTFNPALVVGIGGTGIKAIRCLKKYLTLHKVNEVKVLGIDSDISENDKYREVFPALDPASELVILSQSTAISTLERASRKSAGEEHILKFLPATHDRDAGIHQEVRDKIGSQKGAGQFRRAGKLLFVSNVESGVRLDSRVAQLNEATNQLETKLDRIQRGYDVEVGTRIFVVCSIAGGQGAGALIDCLALLRMHFSGAQDQITAICLLPGPLIDRELFDGAKERPVTRSNALGTLRELQALQLGQASKTEFVFSKSNKFKRGTKQLANQIFLLDHSTFDRRQASTQIDLARAMGFFLYSFVGSGIGAHKEVGSINSGREESSAESAKEIPEIFGSFGVAALEYPTEAIAEYGLRASLAQWLDKLASSAMDKKTVGVAADTLLMTHHLRSPEEIRTSLTPAVEEIKFFPTKGQEDQLVSMDDSPFFSKVSATCESLAEDFARHDQSIGDLLAAATSNLESEIRKQLFAQLKHGVHSAKHFLEALEDRLNALATANSTVAQGRPKGLRTLDDELKGKAGWINKIPVFDKSLKRTYAMKFREYLRERLAEKMDAPTAKHIDGAQSVVGHLKADLEDFKRSIDTLRVENQKAIRRLVETESDSCFIQSMVSHKDLPTWIASRLVTVPSSVELASLDESALIATPLAPIIEKYKELVSNLDLLADLKLDQARLKKAVTSLETASQPLIVMSESAPKLEDLRPLKFVAGAVSPSDSTIRLFKRTGSTEVKAVGNGDPQRLICLQAVQGFGVAHWSRFDEAEKHYREREWRSHTLPDAEKFPPLKALTEDSAQSLRDLGLAMAFGFVDVRQPNYYRNLVLNELEKCHWFIGYTADPNAGATVLIDAGLVKMPPKSAAKRSKTSPDFLAGSLEETAEKLQSASEADYCALIHDVLGNLNAEAGRGRVAAIVGQFAEGDLDAMITRSQSNPARQQILRSIQQALGGYCTQLK